MRFWRACILMALILLTASMVVLAHGDEDDGDGDAHDHEPAGTTVVLDFLPTYYEHVKPIIADNCLTCHTEGQIATDVSLADDVLLDAPSDVAFVTDIQYMPPWMPSTDSMPLQHNRSLTDYERTVISTWAAAGGPAGDPAAYVVPEAPYDLPEIRADQTLQLEEGYMPEEGVADDYRCFTFTPEIDSPVYLTGYEFLPDVAEMVHHGIVYLLDESAASSIQRRNFEDGRPGWSCYTGTGVNSRSEEFIGTWTPGTLPVVYPAGTGYVIEPGDQFIVQLHYNLLAAREPDRTAINLQYADGSSDLAELRTLELQGPVEIPCPTGVTGPQCDRDVAIERVTALYGEQWLDFRPDGLLDQCDQTITDYADNIGEAATTYCDFTVPFGFTVLGVYGHMHELGVEFQLELNPDSDAALTILDIPRWDFHWQDRYQLEEPLRVSGGDTVRMTCTWDNTLSDDPRYVVWGEGTADEMCFATVMVTAG